MLSSKGVEMRKKKMNGLFSGSSLEFVGLKTDRSEKEWAGEWK